MSSVPHSRPPVETRAQASDVETDDAYASRRCDEAEILAKFPGLQDRPDDELISIVADGPAIVLPGEDADEITAAATIVLQRRIDGTTRPVPA